MSALTIEERVSALEIELRELKDRINGSPNGDPWMDVVWGSFANDPAFEKAMQYGREYRESLRPRKKTHKRKKSSK